MIDWNDCLPTKEMQVDFERFKELKTTEEKEAFKKEMQDKYNKLPEAQKEAYKKASEAGLKATVNACNDYIERVEEAILRDKLGELPSPKSNQNNPNYVRIILMLQRYNLFSIRQ